ncbi:hypothetical protein JXB31_05305 [Candidatus Woesearchaeota archaeon]|nr:hypothetical protein [Candidatus Woesearchaeota archaeon]
MAEKDLLEELDLIKQSIKQHTGTTSPFSVTKDNINDLLKDIQGEKIGSIKRVMEEIDLMINERKQLSVQIVSEINTISTKVDSMLMEAAHNPENHREMLSLKEKQILIEEAKVRERVECWRDIAGLKRELRERIKEFTDQESKINLLDNIISQQPK